MRYKERDESFEEDDYRANNVLKYALIFITIYVIILSFLPLIKNLTSKSGFITIGLTPYTMGSFQPSNYGSYTYTSDNYQVLFSGINREENKPKIYLHPDTLPSFLADLVELSDRESSANSEAFSSGQLKIKMVDDNTLLQSYQFSNFTVNKTTKVYGNSTVITYRSATDVAYSLSIWRWYFDGIKGFDKTSFGSSDSMTFKNINNISFSFNSTPAGSGMIAFSSPINITTRRDDTGINKLSVEAAGKTFSMRISGKLVTASSSPIPIFLSSVFANNFASILFPLATVAIFSIYWKRWGK